MKASVKAKRAPKRDLFAELSEGMEALAHARGGKRTLSRAPCLPSIFGQTFARSITGNRVVPSRMRRPRC